MASFATPELAQAWNDRKLDLKLKRMQKYNDLLYARLTKIFTNGRASIDDALHAAVNRGVQPSDLNVTIYTYDYRWTVHDLKDTFPMSYYAIVKHTDICDRLGLFFGGNNFVVRVAKLGESDYQLVLHYYPDGVNETQKLHAERCARDNVGREQAFAPHIEWFEGMYFEDIPATPPRVTMAPPPPPELLRRRGYVRDYNSFEDAARDLGRELMREACYCRHDSDSE